MDDAALGLMFLSCERDQLSNELESASPERKDEIFERLQEIDAEESELCEEAEYQQDDHRDARKRAGK